MQKPPKTWEPFCEKYLSDTGYWYIPKGLAVKEDNFSLIQSRLKLLKRFEYNDWSKVQHRFVNSLRKSKLFDRRVFHRHTSDDAAIGRMFKVVVSSLGLAWINEKEKVYITPTGNSFIKSKGNMLAKIINSQVRKYQFYNPSFPHKQDFTSIKVLPIYFLSEVFAALENKSITKEEYVLFIAKKKSHEEIDTAINEIERFRRLNNTDKEKIILYLKSRKIQSSNQRRSSIYNTIWLESSYALDYYTSSGLFKFKDSIIRPTVSENELLKHIDNFRKNCIWIDFKSHKDWFYYYGDTTFDSSIKFALDYYLDISDTDNAIRIYKIAKDKKIYLPELRIDEKQFRSVIVDEKILEDFLEKHLDKLERDLYLLPNGRQYPTISGPIDLLAKDKYGNYVIIELKKGRTSDKVIGQVSRYVSFISTNLTTMKKVRAIIIGKTVDKNLCLSIKVLRCSCNLYEYDYKIKFDKKA